MQDNIGNGDVTFEALLRAENLQFLYPLIQLAAMAFQNEQLHFVLLPLMAQGHMIPMVDIARLLARRGVSVTIITTPQNAIRFEKIIGRDKESGLRIQMIEFHFPGVEAGLPEGCENLDMLPSINLASKLFAAASKLQEPTEELLAELKPQPTCIISDASLWWTNQVAQKFQIPRLVFHGTCCFSSVCIENLLKSRVFKNVSSDTEYFVIPGLPNRIELTKPQVPGFVNASISGMKVMHDQMREAEMKSYGIVVNSFEELEMEYFQEYAKEKNKKVWCIGPVSLCNKEPHDQAERGNRASIYEHICLEWLELWEANSVIYVCLGSLSRLPTAQMIELALGLEASQRPFIWAIRYKADEFGKWLSQERFEERNKKRGILIHGWAPQVLILSHPAIGGFLTHCGWNSTLEGISSGVPLITWPMFGEQFCNEKMIVNVLGIGVSIGAQIPVAFGEEERVGVQVKETEIKAVLDGLMDEGQEAEERRQRARKLGKMAKNAFEEGGSSYLNMTLLIQNIMENSKDERSIKESKKSKHVLTNFFFFFFY